MRGLLRRRFTLVTPATSWLVSREVAGSCSRDGEQEAEGGSNPAAGSDSGSEMGSTAGIRERGMRDKTWDRNGGTDVDITWACKSYKIMMKADNVHLSFFVCMFVVVV